MATWIKLDKFAVIERKEGAIYKTKQIGSEWFDLALAPETYVTSKDANGVEFHWVNTGAYEFGKEKPTT